MISILLASTSPSRRNYDLASDLMVKRCRCSSVAGGRRSSAGPDPRPRGMVMLRKLWIVRWKSVQATHRRQQERKMLCVFEVKEEIRVIVRSRRLHCLTVLGLLVGLSACGGGGGSSFGGPIPTGPTPSISSLSPSSVTAGDPGFTLTVNGSNFISSTARSLVQPR
jgi:hypothetical protein